MTVDRVYGAAGDRFKAQQKYVPMKYTKRDHGDRSARPAFIGDKCEPRLSPTHLFSLASLDSRQLGRPRHSTCGEFVPSDGATACFVVHVDELHCRH